MTAGVALNDRRWPLSEAAGGYIDASLADQTKQAYVSDWAAFTRWCETAERRPLPADPVTVADYLAAEASRLAASTLARRVAAINKVHELSGHRPPPGSDRAVQAVLAGIRRRNGAAPRRMAPLMIEDLRRVLSCLDFDHYPSVVAARRDACLLVFGFAGAFRRSELSDLNVADVSLRPADGLHVRVPRSKTDQEGHGMVKGLPFGSSPQTCPACAYVGWVQLLAARDRAGVLASMVHRAEGHVCRCDQDVFTGELGSGPLFCPVDKHGVIRAGRTLTGQAINEMVRRRCAAAGIGPGGYGSHSMRAGFVTQALQEGATEYQVMRQTGHRSPATIAVYDRENNPLRGNAVLKVGL